MYKLERDAKRSQELREDDFKSNIFANDPKLYDAMFKNEGDDFIDDEDIGHVVLNSEEDFNKLIT
jgi:hypothetical protein